MIPVLGVPILTKHELLQPMLDSIDVEVGRIIVIDNGMVLPPSERVIHPGRNLGVAASWNRIIEMTPDAAWWALVNFDLVFGAGDLDRLTEHMERVGGCAILSTFQAFGVDRKAIDTAGTFDENFHPAYFEDNDFDYRCRLTGVPLHGLSSRIDHKISSTISVPVFRRENNRTFPINSAYYRRKWGGPPREEVFTTPFNRGGSPAFWELEPDRLELLSWKI